MTTPTSMNGVTRKPSQAVLTCTVRNKTGAVAEVASYLLTKRCNIKVCYALRLRQSVFTLTSLVEADEDDLAELNTWVARDLAEYSPKLVPVSDVKKSFPTDSVRYKIQIIACDQEGIVKEVTTVLPNHGIDIVEMAGVQYPGPFSGTPLFCLELKVDVPTREAADRAKTFLERLARHCNWEFSMAVDDSDTDMVGAKFPPLAGVQRVRVRRNGRKVTRRRTHPRADV